MVKNPDGTVDFEFREADDADAAAAGKPDVDNGSYLKCFGQIASFGRDIFGRK
jgi:hypothetical protein